MATASSVTNTWSQVGIILPEQFADFLETNFGVIQDDMANIALQGLDMWNEKNTSLDHEKHTAFVGFGTVPKNRDSADLALGQVIQGYDNTYTPEGFRLGYRYEDKLRRTAQYNLISKIQRALIQAGRDTIELWAALPFNLAFSATVPFICADGMNLCDKLRPLEDASGTWDNEDTAAALDVDSIEDMDNNFAGTVNGRNLKRPLRMAEVIVPRALKRKALEITQSDKNPDDNLNAKNIFKGVYTVKVWDYLTSSTAWFGRVKPNENDYQLYWYWGLEPEVKTWKDGQNIDVTIQRIKMDFTQGADRPHGLRGNAGA
jgi:hypothetical protein